jgi:hypothetical protein
MNSHNELVTEGIDLSACLNISPKLNYEFQYQSSTSINLNGH